MARGDPVLSSRNDVRDEIEIGLEPEEFDIYRALVFDKEVIAPDKLVAVGRVVLQMVVYIEHKSSVVRTHARDSLNRSRYA